MLRLQSSELTNIKINERAIYTLINGQNGPVARHIRELGMATVQVSRALVDSKSGRLAKSIKMTRDRSNPSEYAVLVGSNVNYALYVHQGTRPHVIESKNPVGFLKFRGPGGVVYTGRVHHPGSRPERFLTDALRIVIRTVH